MQQDEPVGIERMPYETGGRPVSDLQQLLAPQLLPATTTATGATTAAAAAEETPYQNAALVA
jgi:hypothetical protein